MAASLCNHKCYIEYPGIEDPYRWPCANGTKCILQTSLCDGDSDCEDGSDEENCSLVTQVGLKQTLLFVAAFVVLSWILFFLLITCDKSIGQQGQSVTDPASSSSTCDHTVPSYLLHPALSDMDNPSWNWQEVGEQLRIEAVFFNRDPQVLFGFLYHIEAQNAHPDTVHSVFMGFNNYLTTRGYDHSAVAFSMKQTIGHHSKVILILMKF